MQVSVSTLFSPYFLLLNVLTSDSYYSKYPFVNFLLLPSTKVVDKMKNFKIFWKIFKLIF